MNISQLVTGPLSVNTWCVPLDSRRMMVVDPGGDADSIIAHISARDSTVALILLTHGHFDHMIGLPALARAWPEASIAIHGDDAVWLGDGALARHYAFFAELGAGSVVSRYKDELPEATQLLAEGQPLAVGVGETVDGWTVMHTPGHSPGSVCLYNEAEHTLIAGDTLFKAGYGRTDASGGDYAALADSLSRLFKLPAETLVLPGHGGTTTIGKERF